MDVERARAELKERHEADRNSCSDGEGKANDSDGESSCTPVVVCESISRADFRRWLTRHEGQLRRWHYEPITPTTGRVVVYSLPTRVHERTAGSIIQHIFKQVQRIGNDIDLIDTLHTEASTTIDVGDREQESDQSLMPRDAPVDAFPNLVVEIAYKHESWQLLTEKLARWMRPDTTVQIAIGIQICEVRRRAVSLQRNGSHDSSVDDDGNRLITQQVDFAADQPAPAPLPFPLRALYHGAPIPQALAGHEDDAIVIDLVELRAVIAAVVPRRRSERM